MVSTLAGGVNHPGAEPPMPELDIRTLVLTTAVVMLVIAAYLASFRLGSKSLAGAGNWSLGSLAGGIGLLLIALRHLLPDWLSVVGANLLVGLFAVLVWVGLCRFLGRRVRPWPHPLWMAALAAGFVYWTYAQPSVSARVVAIGVFVSGYCLGCVWLLLGSAARQAVGSRNWFLAACFAATALTHLGRASHVLWFEAEMASLLGGGVVHAVSLLIFACGSLLITTGLVFLGLQRMEHDLRRAKAELRQFGGLLPICASCKRIRDDQGYWHQVEAYIQSRSEAEFTHGICPECLRRLYPDVATEVLERVEARPGACPPPPANPAPTARP